MSRTRFTYFLQVVIFFVIYFVTAKFGLSLQSVSRFATLVWIPTGFSLAMLLLFGFKVWPSVALGAFFVNLTTGASPLVASGIALGNTFEAVFGAYMLRRFFGFDISLSRLKDILCLVAITAPLASWLSATIGITSLYLGRVITSSQYLATWIPWWIGDVISVFIVTPFILLWSQGISFNRKPLRIFEFTALFIVVFAVGIFIFNGTIRTPLSDQSLLYLVFPPIIWAALRFGQREVAAILVIYSGLAIWDTMFGFGPFTNNNVTENLLFLQCFMIITSLTSSVLAAVVSERRILEMRKDDFISMASHELRTPVTSLRLYSEIVNTKINEKKYIAAKKHLKKLNAQIRKLTTLVVDLLDISSIQSGKLHIKKTSFNINILVADTVDSVRKTTKVHSLTVKGKITKEVVGDRDRIYQVLINLLANAIKYSPDGGKVIIQCKNIRDSAQISISDPGVGIDKNDLQRIFEKLYRAGNNKMFPGLGIGLFVSAEIIKMHKGKIWAESKKNKGSTFYFTLPFKNP